MASLFELPLLMEEDQSPQSMHTLLDLPPQFFITKLTDKPQNPILDTLNAQSKRPLPPPRIPEELAALISYHASRSSPKKSIWNEAVKVEGPTKNHALSWDSLRATWESKAFQSAFLSEQGDSLFAATRFHVMPRLHDPSVQIVHVSAHDLFESLSMVVLGTASTMHAWDKNTEIFIQAGTLECHTGVLLIDGRDEVISQSILRRFLNIGSLLRRLDNLVSSLRSKSAKEGPTIHAFTHILSSILQTIRQNLEGFAIHDESQAVKISTLWTQHSRFEDMLTALGSLCSRDLSITPNGYEMPATNPTILLTRIYDHLHLHIDKQSSREIIGTLAYTLTRTSKDYLHRVCQSVGFGPQDLGYTSLNRDRRHRQRGVSSIEGDEDGAEDEEDLFEGQDEAYPAFFSPPLARTLSPAKRSLQLLKAAEPDHPLLKMRVDTLQVRWAWTEDDANSLWREGGALDTASSSSASTPSSSPKNDTSFSQFKIFDMVPGSQLLNSAFLNDQTGQTDYQSFIDKFPSSLPSITPTLPNLTELVFMPLAEHVLKLSSTLLSLFLTPTSPMYLHTHLVLLRSYLLLTSPAFKSRLTVALFSDAETFEPSEGERWKHQRQDNGDTWSARTPRPWAVGLAAALTERDTWPPGGADLSFHLRTVIVDSLESRNYYDEVEVEAVKGPTGRQQIMTEAEFRLGFAIRDLPTGSGRDRWLDPMSIEALDFLYLDYKPPRPLGVLITPDILSKYQRVFAFMLRLMRVESVSASLYRMTRKGTRSLFPTLTTANRTLLHFRFISHSFVTAVSAHVSSTAIAGNFDPFLSKIGTPDLTSKGGNFTDVFALAKAHSAVMDDILSACLLRSGQRAVGDILRGALETVLELGLLAGELESGSLEEYRAAPRLEDLYSGFKGKLKTLAKVLRSLSQRDGPTSMHSVDVSGRVEGQREGIGGADSLYHLLIRLDAGGWWSQDH